MKLERHNAIRDLLAKSTVTSQDGLRRKLAAKGFHVTQATLSRDIRDLRLSKGPSGYSVPGTHGQDAEDEGPTLTEVLNNFGIEARQSQNLIVVIATTGGAQPIAATIDYEEFPGVLGTIAGDDTVLIICESARKATQLRAQIEAQID